MSFFTHHFREERQNAEFMRKNKALPANITH